MITSSPEEINISEIVPETSDGISIDALSDSNTRIVSSGETVSPGETGISLTSAPSIPSPRSGSVISLIIGVS